MSLKISTMQKKKEIKLRYSLFIYNNDNTE